MIGKEWLAGTLRHQGHRRRGHVETIIKQGVDCLRERRRGSGRDAVDLVVGPAGAHVVNDNGLVASWTIPPGQ